MISTPLPSDSCVFQGGSGSLITTSPGWAKSYEAARLGDHLVGLGSRINQRNQNCSATGYIDRPPRRTAPIATKRPTTDRATTLPGRSGMVRQDVVSPI